MQAKPSGSGLSTRLVRVQPQQLREARRDSGCRACLAPFHPRACRIGELAGSLALGSLGCYQLPRSRTFLNVGVIGLGVCAVIPISGRIS